MSTQILPPSSSVISNLAHQHDPFAPHRDRDMDNELTSPTTASDEAYNRGRRRTREEEDDDDDGDSDNDGEGADTGPGGGNSKKRRRSRKGMDKKFECPHEGCGKSYSRAEHLYRHQLNRKFPP
jgi:hypothetical protein